LEKEKFPLADAVFGTENEGSWNIFYCRNNIMVILDGAADAARILTGRLDSLIQIAPNGMPSIQNPGFIITDQFKKAFYGTPVSLINDQKVVGCKWNLGSMLKCVGNHIPDQPSRNKSC
jgi:hypothetical protein